ncbi:hypothetical protein [Thiolinea disciformis]|uniref:hypothetical protein n=1 Tax=Thiolinea disciformis TaxID=125614 RepID=UPI0003716A13|nr:hypothetical protein [Thiolinea disciformis]
MNNSIQAKPVSISSQDIQRFAQQAQARALRARSFSVDNTNLSMQPMSRLVSSMLRSIYGEGQPSNTPLIAGGRPVNPPQQPIEQVPIVAGGISVPPPVTAGLVATEAPISASETTVLPD